VHAVASATVQVPPFNPSIVLTATVGTVPGVCADTSDLVVPAGTRVYYCYTVHNTGQITLTSHELYDSEFDTLFSNVAYTLAPGARVSTLDLGMQVSATVTAATAHLAIWDAFLDAAHAIVATAVAHIRISNAGLVVTATAGLDPLNCAQASLLVVKPGTSVYFCALANNSGGVTLTHHSLTDMWGGYHQAFTYDLAPGANVALGRDLLPGWQPINALQDLTNTIVVTGATAPLGEDGILPAGAFVASAQATARVLIDSDDDTIPDVVEGTGDTDADGFPDYLDSDADNDGFPDREEVGPDPMHPRATGCRQLPDYLDPTVPGAPRDAAIADPNCGYFPLLRR
jgi:hypothetical protein